MNYDIILKEANYIKTKSMPKFPHEYTLKENWLDKKLFEETVIFIRENGVEENFFKKKYIYYYLDNYKYWTMGNSIELTILINRVEL